MHRELNVIGAADHLRRLHPCGFAYEKTIDYRTCGSSSGRDSLAWQPALRAKYQPLTVTDSFRPYRNTDRPNCGRCSSMDALRFNRIVAIFSFDAGGLSVWRLSPLRAGVARQY